MEDKELMAVLDTENLTLGNILKKPFEELLLLDDKLIKIINRAKDLRVILGSNIEMKEAIVQKNKRALYKKHVYHRPYKNADGLNPTRQEAPLNHNTYIGNKHERDSDPNLKRMARLNNIQSFEDQTLERAESQVRMLLSNLQLPLSLQEDVMHRFSTYHAQLPKRSQVRGTDLLVPATLYITCKCNNVKLNKKHFYDLMECSKKQFNTVLQAILRNNKDLMIFLRKNENRQQEILTLLSSLDINNGFIPKARDFLKENWPCLKGKKNEIVAGMVHGILENRWHSNRKACQKINVEVSAVSTAIKKFKELKNGSEEKREKKENKGKERKTDEKKAENTLPNIQFPKQYPPLKKMNYFDRKYM